MESPTPSPSWLGRNWKWLLPLGAVGGLMACVACFALFFFGIMSTFKSSDVYIDALHEVQTSQTAIDALGTPIEAGFLVSGNIETNQSGGRAFLDIPVSGPDGSGIVHVRATRENGTWQYSEISLSVAETGQIYDLLNDN